MVIFFYVFDFVMVGFFGFVLYVVIVVVVVVGVNEEGSGE